MRLYMVYQCVCNEYVWLYMVSRIPLKIRKWVPGYTMRDPFVSCLSKSSLKHNAPEIMNGRRQLCTSMYVCKCMDVMLIHIRTICQIARNTRTSPRSRAAQQKKTRGAPGRSYKNQTTITVRVIYNSTTATIRTSIICHNARIRAHRMIERRRRSGRIRSAYIGENICARFDFEGGFKSCSANGTQEFVCESDPGASV